MKKISIGKKQYRVCVHKDDINFKRFVMFKQYVPMIWEKMDSPLFETYFERVKTHYDNGRHSDGLLELINYKSAINNINKGHDAWAICFALIVLGKDEDQTEMDESFLISKVDGWIKDGLTAGQVHEAVVDFMKASPEVFSAHLTMLSLIGEGNIFPESKDTGKSS